MIPKSMKKPVWLVPVCIASLTLGIFLILTVSTGFAPDLRDRADSRGGIGFLLLAGVLNILGPIGCLLYHSWGSQREKSMGDRI